MTALSGQLRFIGWIHTPYRDIADCPRRPWARDTESVIEIGPEYLDVVDGLTVATRLHVLWWAHRANRDIRRRRPAEGAPLLGVLASRGVHRPNPIGLTPVEVIGLGPGRVTVRGMDCIDGTPLLDLKPVVSIPGHWG